MLPPTVRSMRFWAAALVPMYVRGDSDTSNDSVTFAFGGCVLSCIELAGYSANAENDQKTMCLASRENLLEAVEQCMVSTCATGLADVIEELLTPMQTGCKGLEVPIPDADIEAAEAAAWNILVAAITSTLESLEFSETKLLPATSGTPSSIAVVAQTTLTQGISTSVMALIEVVSNSTQSAFASQPNVESSATGSHTTTDVTSMFSSAMIASITANPPLTSSSSVVLPVSTLASLSETSAPSAQAVLQLSTSQIASVHSAAPSTLTENPGVTSTLTSAEETTTTKLTSTTSADKGKTTGLATSASTSDEDSTSTMLLTAASDTSDDSLLVDTGTPTTYTGIIFVTPTPGSAAASSSSSGSSSAEEYDGIGGGSPFSTSAATFMESRCGLAALSVMLTVLYLFI